MNEEMDFEYWLEYGYKKGWVGPPICDTHDGTPISEEEFGQFEEGGDPCIHVLRLYEDKEHKEQVEHSHSPSIWRASNSGLMES